MWYKKLASNHNMAGVVRHKPQAASRRLQAKSLKHGACSLKHEKGVALISAIIVITMVSIMLTTYVALTINERQRVERQSIMVSAEYIARAGLEQAFLDLSCEYGRDGDWSNNNPPFEINGKLINGGVVVDPASAVFSEDVDKKRSNYVMFYNWTDFSGDSLTQYKIEIAFAAEIPANCPGASCAFLPNRLWVKSTGKIKDSAGNTLDEVALVQIASIGRVKNITLDRIYNKLTPAETEANAGDEIRIAAARLKEGAAGITIDKTLIIKGGYGTDFSDGSRDTTTNFSIIDNSLGTAVTISGSAVVTMGGVRIE